MKITILDDGRTEHMRKALMSESMMAGFRPAVRADVVVEFKAFVSGFDQGQLGIHMRQAMKDVSYLTTSRLGQVIALRADHTAVRVYVIKPNAAGEMKWQSL